MGVYSKREPRLQEPRKHRDHKTATAWCNDQIHLLEKASFSFITIFAEISRIGNSFFLYFGAIFCQESVAMKSGKMQWYKNSSVLVTKMLLELASSLS